jgi:protein-glutamine gamma-glutamyltransferase
MLDIMGPEEYDKAFKGIPLGGWYFPQGPANMAAIHERVFVPGDCRMFFNPDAKNPAFRNENTIFLGNGLYYGHGIGIKSLDDMIAALNELNPKKSASPDKKAGFIDPKTLPERINK